MEFEKDDLGFIARRAVGDKTLAIMPMTFGKYRVCIADSEPIQYGHDREY